MREIVAGTADAAGRRVIFFLVGTDGITPATGEAGGQPEISVDEGAFASAGIGTLVLVDANTYYAVLDAGTVATIGTRIETRYQSATAALVPGDSVIVIETPKTVEEITAEVIANLTGITVTVVSPLSADGKSLAIDRGLSYPSPAIRWNQDGADWPDLSGLTVTVTTDRGVVYEATPGGTDPDQTITLALTSAQSAAVPLGAATWEVSAADGGEAVLEFKVAVTAT